MKKNLFYILILLFVLVYITGKYYYEYNSANIYENRGNNYYKNNNIKKAAENYEKAIDAGNTNIALRSNYADILMRQPVTVDSQEKLVKFLENSVQDTISERVKFFLYDLKRDVHEKYPNNYIQQAPQERKILHWGKLPITYAFKNVSMVPKEYGYEIVNAFKEWENTGILNFRYTENPDADIIIEFINNENKNLENGQ